MNRSTRRLLARLIADRSGASAIMIGLAMTAMLGFAGLGTEVGAWYLTKRSMQGAADASAFSAATGYVYGENSAGFRAEAKSVAASFGFVDATNGVTVTINNPPATGAFTANPLAIEVIIQEPQTRLISSLFLASNPTVATRAVALAGAPGNGCVLTLDQANVDDVFNNGNTVVNLNACDLYINAGGNNALTLTGQATLNITQGGAYIHGGYNGGGTLNDFSNTHFGAPIQPDPFQNVNVPSYSGCNQNFFHATAGSSPAITLSGSAPYVFCNGLQIDANATVNLPSGGIYVIDQGMLNVAGSATLTGTDVTIILTSSTGSNYATAQIAGGANVTLSATTDPASPYYGIALYQDRNAPSNGANSTDQLVGGANMNITGVSYFPSQLITYTGNTTTGAGASTCNPIVALRADFKGASNFSDSCPGYPGFGKKIGLIPTKLVE